MQKISSSNSFHKLAEGYRRFLGERDFLAFFQRVPWALNGCIQQPDPLLETMIGEAERFSETTCTTKFSIITPMWNTPPRFLQEAVFTCQAQTYPNWELVLVDDGSPNRQHVELLRRRFDDDDRIVLIENHENRGIGATRNVAIDRAAGDYVCILDHDDLLHPQALGIFARYIKEDPGLNFLFTNEAKIDEDSRRVRDFFFKPTFDLSTLIRTNYIAHLVAIQRKLLVGLREKNGHMFRTDLDGVEDHDLFLRLALSGEVKSLHVPLFCYFWRISPQSTASQVSAKPAVVSRGRKMLNDVLQKNFPKYNWDIKDPVGLSANRLFTVRFHGGDVGKRTLVVIPFRDNAAMTIRALESLCRQKTRMTITALVINHRSVGSEKSKVESWLKDQKALSYEMLDYDGAFNYAKIHNIALKGRDDCEFIFFLNNDVVLKSPEILSSLANELLINPGLGFAGLRLVFNGSDHIQHGGIRISRRLTGGDYHIIDHADQVSEFVFDQHIAAAVTFACVMTTTRVLRTIGEFEEDFLPNGLGDVDMCLRAISKGYHNFYFGDLYGVHDQSKTRRPRSEDFELMSLFERHGSALNNARVKQMGYDLRLHSSLTGDERQFFDLPLRYRVADRINDHFKRSMGPLHRWLRNTARHRFAR